MSYHDRIDRLAAHIATSETVMAEDCAKVTGWTTTRALVVLDALKEEGLILDGGARNLRARPAGRPTRLFRRREGVVIPAGWRDQTRIDDRAKERADLVAAGLCIKCSHANDSLPLKACSECRKQHKLQRVTPTRPGAGSQPRRAVLAALARGPATTPELVVALSMTHGTIYGAVKTLVAAGSVMRVGTRQASAKPSGVWGLKPAEPDPALVRGIREKVADCPVDLGDLLGWILSVGSGAQAIGMASGPIEPLYHAGNFPVGFRRALERLVQVMLLARGEETDREARENFVPADGQCLCSACGLTYSRHTEDPFDRWLHVVCNGRRVKL